ncbi:MAG: MFS transporter [Pseudomonadales bacterium]
MKTLPPKVWRLMLAFALMSAGSSMMVLIAGIIGTDIAPSPEQATLPMALVIVGIASMALPVGSLQTRFGRRKVFICFGLVAIFSAGLAAWALSIHSFSLFCLSAYIMGGTMAATQQYRFAAIEAVPVEKAPIAASTILLGGLLAVFVGPEVAVAGRALLDTDFAGSFLLLLLVFALGTALVASVGDSAQLRSDKRTLWQGMTLITSSPVLLLAASAAAIGFGVMTLVMTATPITMHNHVGHSLSDTKLIIQWHMAAMFLPSLVSGWLIAKLGYRVMMWLGILSFAVCIVVAFIDTSFIHFWLSLVLLGIGWNFLFVSGTALLGMGHSSEERFSVQASNDFIVFSVQALAALGSGWLLFNWQWHGVLWVAVPLLVAFTVFLLRTKAFASLQKQHSSMI